MIKIAHLWRNVVVKPVVAAVTNLGNGATDLLVPPTLPNGRLCFCPGDVATYTCTVVGGIVTVWSGTAFDCPASNNRIALLHSHSFSGGEAGDCTSGAIRAASISVDTSGAEPCYTSELSVTISVPTWMDKL